MPSSLNIHYFFNCIIFIYKASQIDFFLKKSHTSKLRLNVYAIQWTSVEWALAFGMKAVELHIKLHAFNAERVLCTTQTKKFMTELELVNN